MPIIVRNTLATTVTFGQVRRIQCLRCREAFRYLALPRKHVSVRGKAYEFKNEAELEVQLDAELEWMTGLMTRKPRTGDARCPHCFGRQPWMVPPSFFVTPLIVAPALLLGVAGLQSELVEWAVLGLGTALVGGLGQIVWFALLMWGDQAKARAEGLSMTDRQFDDFQAAGEGESEVDMTLRWFLRSGFDLKNSHLAVLPFRDLT